MKINGNTVSCAGNFALRARCKLRGELRTNALVASRALLGFALLSREAKNAYSVFLS